MPCLGVFVHKHLIILAGLMEKVSILQLINYFSISKIFPPTKSGSCTTTAYGEEGPGPTLWYVPSKPLFYVIPKTVSIFYVKLYVMKIQIESIVNKHPFVYDFSIYKRFLYICAFLT